MKLRFLGLLMLAPMAGAQVLTGPLYNQTDVISTNAIALTNKTFDCSLNTCLNFGGGTTLFSTSTLNIPGTYTRSTNGQNSFASTTTLTGSENNDEYASMDFLLSPGAFTNSHAGSTLTTVAKFKDGVNNASAVGGFGGIEAIVSIDGTTGNSSTAGQYTSGTFIAKSGVNDNGGSGTEKGSLFAMGASARLTTGATFWQQVVGGELDVAAETGTSVLDKLGLQVVEKADDAVQGTRDNLGITLNNSSGSLGTWDVGLSFGNYNGNWPFSATSTMIGCVAHAHSGSCGTTLNGIDFRNITFTGSAFASNSFTVDGSGNITGNSELTPTYTNAAIVINKNASTNTTEIGDGSTSGLITIGGGSDSLTLNLSTVTGNSTTFNINANASTNITNIGTGSTSGNVNIGGGSDSVIINAGTTSTIKATTLVLNGNASTNVTNIGTGSTSGLVTIGGGSDNVTINAGTLSLTGTLSGTTISNYLAAPPAIGGTTPAGGAFTTLSASSTVSGTGFSAYLASPPAIGGTAPAAGNFTTLGASGLLSPTLGITVTGADTNIEASDNHNTNINTGTSTGTFTAGQNTATPSSVVLKGPVSFQAGTAYTAANWGLTSPVWNGAAMTLNDTTASGTVTNDAAYTLQVPTFTSTGGASTTITNVYTQYVNAPVCSGGVVCTNLWGIYSTGQIGGTKGMNVSGGTAQINASSNFASNIGTGTTTSNVTIGGGSNGVIINGNGNGSIKDTAIISTGTKFTTTGCSVSSTTGGAAAGTFTLGANNCTVVITINGATGLTAPNGWTCQAHDRTTVADLIGGESSSTTTTASITIPVTVGSTDVISFGCTGY